MEIGEAKGEDGDEKATGRFRLIGDAKDGRGKDEDDDEDEDDEEDEDEKVPAKDGRGEDKESGWAGEEGIFSLTEVES